MGSMMVVPTVVPLYLAPCIQSKGRITGVVLAFHAFSGKHVGVDNLNVPRGSARLIDEG